MNAKIINLLILMLLSSTVVAQVGINNTDPKTTLDVSGAITNRETSFAISSNAVNINTETSLANITGAATAAITITAYTPVINGHRLIIYNNTTGGFSASFYSTTIPNLQSVEFIYTNSTWKSTFGGTIAGGNNIYNSNGTLTGNRVVTQGANSLNFSGTGNTFFNAGNVGIGNTDPNLSLDVTSSTGIGTKASSTSQWDHIYMVSNGSGSSINAGGAESGLQFKVGSGSSGSYGGQTYTTDMTLMPSGNVGVGTTTPATKLDVAAGTTVTNTVINASGSINDFLQFNVQNTSTGTQAQSGYSATADNGSATTGFAWMGINNSTFNYPTAYNIGAANDVSFIGSGQDLYLANAHNAKSIIFSTGKSTTPFFNERMRITNAGNVGIGTSSPSGALDVQTNNASALSRSIFFNNGATSRQDIQIGANGAGNLYVGVDVTGALFGVGAKSYLDNRSGGKFSFGNNGNEYFTIGLTGNVGINTSTPNNKLEITQGTAGNSGLRFTNLTSSSTATTPSPSGKVLTVNANGDVILVSMSDMLKAERTANTQYGASGSNINVGTISYENYDGNYSSNLVLPASAPYIGFELSIYCGSSFSTVITTTNTDMGSSVTITTGNTKHFKWGGAKWQLLN
jgi:hypothetical protein